MGIFNKIKNISRAVYDPRYRYMYWQRRITDPAKRKQLAESAALSAPQIENKSISIEAEALAMDGYVPLPNMIQPGMATEMREYFERFDAFSPYHPELGRFQAPYNVPPSIHVSNFDEHVALDAPHALRLANDPKVLQAVSAFLGCKPIVGLIHAWWSSPTGQGPQHAENYHRDYDDFKFAKLFVYLTDVDERSGPHMFIKGSPRFSGLRDRRRYSDQEITNTFPDLSDHISFTGPAGTAFIEDTSGFHKGLPPVSAPRLIFQVLYSLKPYFGGPAKPIRAARDDERDLDPYINQSYLYF
jgi:hypothetical protein